MQCTDNVKRLRLAAYCFDEFNRMQLPMGDPTTTLDDKQKLAVLYRVCMEPGEYTPTRNEEFFVQKCWKKWCDPSQVHRVQEKLRDLYKPRAKGKIPPEQQKPKGRKRKQISDDEEEQQEGGAEDGNINSAGEDDQPVRPPEADV